MRGNMKNNRRASGGQVLSEFVIMLVLMTFVALTLVILLSALSEHAWRVISLVAWEPFT